MIISIQYLRGLAAILVLLSHAAWKGQQYAGDPLGWFHVGASGVDIFFVISGFVMCHTTGAKHRRPFEVVKFLAHRFVRIIPLYWTLSTMALLVFLMVPSMVNTGGGYTDILKSYLLIPTEDKYLIQAGWTLSYEFFFYGIFAVGLFFARPVGHVVSILILGVLFLLGRSLGTGAGEFEHHALLNFATDAILVNFIFGIVLYHLFRIQALPKKLIWLVFAIAAVWFFAVNQNLVQIRYRCFRYGVPAFLLCWGLTRMEVALKNVPSRLASYIGDASYAIYLTHPFTLAITAAVLKKLGLVSSGWFFVVVIAATSIMAGFVCYELIEKRLLHYFRPRVDEFFAQVEARSRQPSRSTRRSVSHSKY